MAVPQCPHWDPTATRRPRSATNRHVPGLDCGHRPHPGRKDPLLVGSTRLERCRPRQAIASLYELRVQDRVRATEALPPLCIRPAHPDDEMPPVPHDRLGLLLVEDRDRGVAEGGEHLKVHGHGRPARSIRSAHNLMIVSAGPTVPCLASYAGPSGPALRQVSSSARLGTMVS